jgi:hypothetical protein
MRMAQNSDSEIEMILTIKKNNANMLSSLDDSSASNAESQNSASS